MQISKQRTNSIFEFEMFWDTAQGLQLPVAYVKICCSSDFAQRQKKGNSRNCLSQKELQNGQGRI